MSILEHFFSNPLSSDLDRVRKLAAEAGWKIKVDNGQNIILGFKDSKDGDIVHVFIRTCGKDSLGKSVLEFSSEATPHPSDIFLAANLALKLLERNGEVILGHWGTEEVGEKKMFTFFHSMVASSMDLNEFKSAVLAIVREISNVKPLFKSL